VEDTGAVVEEEEVVDMVRESGRRAILLLTALINPSSEVFYTTFLLAKSYNSVLKRHLVHDLISISQVGWWGR
jgi:hypothetical protein